MRRRTAEKGLFTIESLAEVGGLSRASQPYQCVSDGREFPWRGGSQVLAGELAGLLRPLGQLPFVEEIVFVNVEVTNVLLFRFASRGRLERRAAEERNFQVTLETMDAEEPVVPAGGAI